MQNTILLDISTNSFGKKIFFFSIFLSEVIKSVNSSLNHPYFQDLQIAETSKKGNYCLSFDNVNSNKKFYQFFIISMLKDFNLNPSNPNNHALINNFLQNLSKYKNIFFDQLEVHERIMSKKLLVKNLNSKFFLPSFTPKEFQKEHAFFMLKNERSGNFSSPGSGKTIITYMSALSLYADKEIETLIVVGPKSAKNAWFEEWKRVSDENIIHADEVFNFANKSKKYIEEFRGRFLVENKLNVLFINFHKFQDATFTNFFLQLTRLYRVFLVIDEAHYIKNYKSDLHINLSKISGELKYVQLLTGTPLPRFSKEGFYIVNFLFPDLINYGSLSENKFILSTKRTPLGGWENILKQKELVEKFKLLFVRKTKASMIKEKLLTPAIFKHIIIEPEQTEILLRKGLFENQFSSQILNNKLPSYIQTCFWIRSMQASSYPPLLIEKWSEVIKDLANDTTDDVAAAEIKKQLDTKTKEKNMKKKKFLDTLNEVITQPQIQNLIQKYEEGKLIPNRWKKAIEILKQHPNERIVIWDVFKKSMYAFRTYLYKELSHPSLYLINGDVDMDKRELYLKQFKNSFNAILIASPATIAESVSLHREVHVAIYLYKNYMGAHFMQSKERIHRLLGDDEKQYQKTFYFIEAKKPSIDQEIMKNLTQKEKEQNNFID